MAKLKLAILGCGDVAQRDYLPEVHRLAGKMEIVAVFSRTETRARSVAHKYDIPRWFTDYRRMLSDTDAELVANLTPIPAHADVTLAALEAGKHVYSEKPMASTVSDAEKIRDAAAARGLMLVCAPCSMIFPQVKYVLSLLQDGAIGEVHSARGVGFGGVPPWGGFIGDQSQYFAEGAGSARDMGVYPLHAITGLLGPAQKVTAMTSRARDSFALVEGPRKGNVVPIEADDNCHLVLDLGRARLASVEANNCALATQAPHLELNGLKGSIAVNLTDVAAPVEIFRGSCGWEKVDVPRKRESGPDHILGVEHLVDCVMEDRQPVLSAEHALHVVEIIEKAAQSSREGRAFPIESTF